MYRLTMAVVASLCVLPFAMGASSPQKAPPGLEKNLSRDLKKEAQHRKQNEAFVITEDTEVKLDGRLCKYEEVPGNAAIILLELAADQKSILKVHFQTKK